MYKQIKWLRCIKYIISVIFCILPMFFSLHGTFTMAPKRPVPFYLSDAFTRWRKRWPKCAPMMRGVTILLKQYFETVESGSFFVTFEYIVLGKVAFFVELTRFWRIFFCQKHYNWRITSWYQVPFCFLWWRLSQLPCLCFPRLWVVVCYSCPQRVGHSIAF